MTQTSATSLAAPPAVQRRSWARVHGSYYWTTLKRYVSNRRWLMMYLLGRFRIVQWLAVLLSPRARSFRESNPAGHAIETFLPHVNVERAVSALRSDGYSAGLQLSGDVVQQVLDFARSHKCFEDHHPDFWFNHREHRQAQLLQGRKILIGRYANTARDCRAIAALQSDPVIWEIAAKYLGAQPRHIGNRLWWSFAGSNVEEHARVRSGQAYHYDLDDYRTVTFFFYMTDVDKLGGPHTLVRGSHAKKKLRYLLSLFKTRDESDLRDYYGAENFIEMCGPAGSGFVEDLFAFHRGNPPIGRDRLILQIRFALNDYGNASDMRADTPEAPRVAA